MMSSVPEVPWFGHALQKLGTFGPLRCREMYALDRLMREAQVLEIVCQLTEERAGVASSAAEGKDTRLRGLSLPPQGLHRAQSPLGHGWAVSGHANRRAGVTCLLLWPLEA